MRRGKEASGSNPLSTLTVAWVVVVGLALAPVGTYVHQTGDVKVFIAFLGASFLVGACLLLAMGLARMGSRDRVTDEHGGIADLRARGALFGKR